MLSKRTFRAAIASVAAATTLFISGCSQQELGRAILMPLPEKSSDVTNHTDTIATLAKP